MAWYGGWHSFWFQGWFRRMLLAIPSGFREAVKERRIGAFTDRIVHAVKRDEIKGDPPSWT